MKMKYLGFVFKVTQERSSEVVPQWGLVGKSPSASLQELSQMVFSQLAASVGGDGVHTASCSSVRWHLLWPPVLKVAFRSM